MAVSKHIKETIDELKKLDLKISTVEEIKQIINKIGGIALFGIEVNSKGMVLRARPNKEDEYYYYEKDISYISDEDKIDKIESGRTNRKGEALFYGCLPQSPEEEDDHQVTSMIEAGIKEDEDKSKIHSYNLTQGKWRITKSFSVVVMVHNEDYIKKNDKLASMQAAYKNFVNEDPDKKDDYLFVSSFMAKEYSKVVPDGHEYQYKISIAFFEVLREFGIKAIAYPSVKGEGTAFNIAMESELVDNNLKLEKVAVWTILMQGVRTPLIYGSLVCLDFNEDGKFIYQESGESPSVMRKVFEGKIKGTQ